MSRLTGQCQKHMHVYSFGVLDFGQQTRQTPPNPQIVLHSLQG